MKSGILVDIKFDYPTMYQCLGNALPERDIINWKDEANRPDDLSKIDYALVWEPDEGLLTSMPDLKVMFSLGAGVDHMMRDKSLPDLPLVRFVDESLTSRMSEWVCLQCLLHLRKHPAYSRQQAQKTWSELDQPDASALRVGVMGLGVLGQDAVAKLKVLGFELNGWSKTKKDLDGVSCYGGDEMDEFLAKSDILVGLLPLTKETSGIFNRTLFAKLPSTTPLGGPIFINAGRGKSQIDVDIVNALQTGLLQGVSLDVFEEEPLPGNSPIMADGKCVYHPACGLNQRQGCFSKSCGRPNRAL